MNDHDPGDEHRDPWPFTCGAVFDVRGDDGAVVSWFSKTPLRDGWYVATATIERSPVRFYPYPGSDEGVQVVEEYRITDNDGRASE